MTPLPRLEHSNISERVYKVLKEQVYSKSFPPGHRLELREIEKQLGVSRTPLKHALTRLALEGLVEIRPRSGTYVTDPSIQEVEQAMDVRLVLEVYAAELAVQRVNQSQIQQARDIIKGLRELADSRDVQQVLQDHIDLDHDLHKLIMETAGNEVLERIWGQVLSCQMGAVRYRRMGEEFDLAMKEHERILAALENRDAVALQQALTRHLERSKRSLRVDWEASDTD